MIVYIKKDEDQKERNRKKQKMLLSNSSYSEFVFVIVWHHMDHNHLRRLLHAYGACACVLCMRPRAVACNSLNGEGRRRIGGVCLEPETADVEEQDPALVLPKIP